jgi:cytidylate kinase
MIIAIDGPAGSGKSTVAKRVARALGFHYLDTGAMYRAVAQCALARGIDVDNDDAAVIAIAEHEPIAFGYTAGDPLPSTVLIGGTDVTREIRTPQVDKAVSPVSACPGVRYALTAQQQQFGRAHDTVMEGRDIGTVVFPAAELKLFLTATPEVRAHRRVLQNAAGAQAPAPPNDATPNDDATNEAKVLASIMRRDAYDSSRATAPLAAAPNSITLDTTSLTINEVVAHIVALAHERGANANANPQAQKAAP